MSPKLDCETIIRDVLGEPAHSRRAEITYRCPHGERHKNGDAHPSLRINIAKDVWMCGPCGGKGKAWALAAFVAGLDAGDKAAVKAWLIERGLLNGAKRSKAKADGRGPCVDEYLYPDAATGAMTLLKRRYEPGSNGEKKDFVWFHDAGGNWQSGLGGRKPGLYRAREIADEPLVILTEGEKDTNTGARIGLPTCTSGGTGTFTEDHAKALCEKRVAVAVDADEVGRKEAQRRAALLYGKAAIVKVCGIPDCMDLAEAIERGWTRDRLLALFDEAPEWRPASGAEILDSLMRLISRFVSLSEAQTRVVALWVVHTHAIDAADCTPYLSVNSAEKQSGKTRLLEVLQLLVAKPWLTGGTTKAALVRKIELAGPSLLLDETDAAFNGEKEYAEALRGVLNNGYRRGKTYTTCIGQGANIVPHDFPVFCPKAIAGIGRLPDTVADRSIPIKLKRARRGTVERFRERDVAREAGELQGKIALCCSKNLEALKNARPEIPSALSDRQADTCEPLLAIADLAGGEWPKATTQALIELCVEAQASDDSTGVQLLRDIKAVFTQKEADELPSCELAESLAAIETSLWGEWNKGRPLSPAKLARLLKPFQIYPDRIGGRDSRIRGYRVVQFEDVFSRYLPESVHPSTSNENSGDRDDSEASTKDTVDTSEYAISAAKYAACGHLDTLKPGYGGQNVEKQPFQAVITGVVE